MTVEARVWEVQVAPAVAGGLEVKRVGARVPSRVWAEAVMRGAPVLAVRQAVAAASAEEEAVVPVVVAVGAVVEVVAGAGKCNVA